MTEPPVDGTASDTDAVPCCPRHPDRESYVRCQRCERPVCPECQRPAAVGVQCVDCVREGARSARAARTVFGGANPTGRPVVTIGLVIACAVAYLAQIVPGSSVTARFAFVPFLAAEEPWRFLTSAFLHSESLPLHILFNLYALWVVGPYLEGLFGRVRFLALYLLSAVGGSVFVFLLAVPGVLSTSWRTAVVGASGAVFGLFAAVVVLHRRLERDSRAMVGLIVVNLVIGFIPDLGIAWQGHLGGLITGAAIAAVLAYAPREGRTVIQVLGTAGVALVLVALTVIKISTVAPGLLVGLPDLPGL
ncbi:MAG: rhomboid family intramembrane serine protease [Actinomycetales bacterium]|nr:rhomboid family intramembrane serine protease [Actinomycetales bacterium]